MGFFQPNTSTKNSSISEESLQQSSDPQDLGIHSYAGCHHNHQQGLYRLLHLQPPDPRYNRVHHNLRRTSHLDQRAPLFSPLRPLPNPWPPDQPLSGTTLLPCRPLLQMHRCPSSIRPTPAQPNRWSSSLRTSIPRTLMPTSRLPKECNIGHLPFPNRSRYRSNRLLQ